MLVLDASMALAWLIRRADQSEADLAIRAFSVVVHTGALIPSLWHAEITNTLLVFERARKLTEQDSTSFLNDLGRLELLEDEEPHKQLQGRLLDLGRRYGLTAYDAVYLELALRTGLPLATFDRQLAEAARKAGARVFGDNV